MSAATGGNGKSGSINPADKAVNTGRIVEQETKSAAASLTLAQVRQQLKGVKGKKFWRSVDELADTPEFRAAVERSFPPLHRSGSIRFRGAASCV